jgi:hypothetical protein
MRKGIKFILFLSSYTPLFIILIIKNINFDKLSIIKNNLFVISLFILIIVSNYALKLSIDQIKDMSPKSIEVKNVSQKTGDTLNYLVTYIIPFITLDSNSIRNITSLGVLLFFMGIIYTNSNLIYTNPILNLFGYKIYEVIDKNDNLIICISKKKYIKIDKPLKITNFSGNVYLEG